MKCPKCQGEELHEMHIEGTDVDFCDSCKGIWFDKDEMAFMAELPNDIPLSNVEDTATQTTSLCPRCEHTTLEEMKFVQANDLLVERCPECRGIWLDKGELPKVERIAARLGDVKSKVLLAGKQLKNKGYEIVGGQIH